MLLDSSRDVLFLSAKRTAFGAFGGALKDLRATDLGTIAAQAALAQADVRPDEIDEVIFGNVLQTTPEDVYCARHIGLRAGLPVETPALTVNRLCGSGFQAIVTAAQEIRTGDAEMALVGGTESMSQAPHAIRGARWGYAFGKAPPVEDLLWTALDRQLRRLRDGPDRRDRRRAPRDRSRRLRRVRAAVAEALGRRRRSRALPRRDRARRGARAQGRDADLRARRAPAAADHARRAGQAGAGVQDRRHRHRRQRVGHRRRRRRAGRRVARRRRAHAAQAARPPGRVGLRRRRSQGDGDRSRACDCQGAVARATCDSTRWI